MYGAINWHDESAAACGEMVFDMIKALGVPLTREIATHIYLAILTDTGSFHHSNITPRTFDICRQTVEAGVEPGDHGAARLRQQQLRQAEADRRAARRDGARRRRPTGRPSHGRCDAGGVRLHEQRHRGDDQPAADRARNSGGCLLQDVGADGEVRVSMRSKYDVDVRAVASEFGGGGHKNAAGFTVAGQLEDVQPASSIGSSRPSTRGCETRPAGMNGVLVVDKPSGPTSHDVVGRVRRALGTRRVGHTGTLDPLATGVLPLVIGRATRLAQFLSSDEKEYVADVAFGVSTSTYDALGSRAAARRRGAAGRSSTDGSARSASSAARYLQTPPAFSAKKVSGEPAYELARRERRRAQAGQVTVTALEVAGTG